MPNRIIKESICESRELSSVSFFAEDVYKRLITYADDYGRFNADSQIILARLYPREIGIVTLDDIDDALTELVGVGKISFYTSQPRKELYGCFPKWKDHQRVRQSKKKCPDPEDTKINDWYLRRFIPNELKKQIIERDGFKCQQCGKYICPTPMSAERLIKMGGGLYHIDHIVPVVQGGRATAENLRLLCPKCNLSRKRHFSFDDMLKFAETCGELPEISALIQSNPIQSESNPNPIRIQSSLCGEKPKSTEKRFTPPTVEEVQAYITENNYIVDAQKFIDYYQSNGWIVGKTKMKDWKATVRGWERREQEKFQKSVKEDDDPMSFLPFK